MKKRASKKVSVVFFVVCCCAILSAQSHPSSSPSSIKGSGCVENAVETSCHDLIDTKTGNTYNLLFSGKVPKAGTAISFKASPHQGMTTCMQGKPVNVIKWKKEKGIKCPPPPQPTKTR